MSEIYSNPMKVISKRKELLQRIMMKLVIQQNKISKSEIPFQDACAQIANLSEAMTEIIKQYETGK
jgi:hypothetical protein